MKKIHAKGFDVYTFEQSKKDFISLTDIARYKNPREPKDVVKNWLRNRSTIEFIGTWELIHNPSFKGVEFDTFKNESGSNSFVLSPQRWIEATGAIGMISKSGKYGGGTFAHIDIAFEFASWISAEFKLYLIKEFQRMKQQENERLSLGWDTKRMLTKINYLIHTDAIKKHLIPNKLEGMAAEILFATEADVLNVSLFGMTAKEWKKKNIGKDGNMRDYADVAQLVCLANLEAMNAELIRQGVSQRERLLRLNEIAIVQMRALLNNATLQKIR